MVPYTDFNLTFYRGDSLTIDLAATLNGQPLDMRGWRLWVTVKRAIGDADAAAIFQGDLTSGITLVDAQMGLATIDIPESATSPEAIPDVAKGLHCFCDIQGADPMGSIFTLAAGRITFYPDTTQRIV